VTLIPYLRIYFERSTGRAVLDRGPGTKRLEVDHVHIVGKAVTAYSPNEQIKPRFWMVVYNAFVKLHAGTAYVSTVVLPVHGVDVEPAAIQPAPKPVAQIELPGIENLDPSVCAVCGAALDAGRCPSCGAVADAQAQVP
jgi:hypothetical protein